ncbi:hypothetical protein N8D56_24650 [Devosia sp. A8/3-2]|nr:hypothetical protein N8D56_24650 [Devosia sp. A8/3-2]
MGRIEHGHQFRRQCRFARARPACQPDGDALMGRAFHFQNMRHQPR